MKWKFEHRVIGGWGRWGLFDQDELILGTDSGWSGGFVPPKEEHARLIEAALDMKILLAKLATPYKEPNATSADNVYDSRDALLRETDHYACLADEASQLLAQIEGGEK